MPFICCCNFVSSPGCHQLNCCFCLLAALCWCLHHSHPNAAAIFAEPCKKSDFFRAKKIFDQTIHNTTLFTPHSFCNSHWLFHCLRGTSGENLWIIFQGLDKAILIVPEEESELGTHHLLPNSLPSEPDLSPGHVCHLLALQWLLWEHLCNNRRMNSPFRIPTSRFSCGAVSKL